MKKKLKKIITLAREKRAAAGKRVMTAIIVASALILSIGCGGQKASVEAETEEKSPIHWTECGYNVGEHGCDISATDQYGNNWSLYDNHGSIVILDFSTTWCGYCQVAASTAQEFQDKYSDNDLLYVTVLVEDSYGNTPPPQQVISEWSDVFGISAPVIGGSRDMLLSGDKDGWEVSGWPTFFVLDSDLKIYDIQRGYSDVNLARIIDSLILREQSTSP